MSEGTETPIGRIEALSRLRSGLDAVSDLAQRLDAAQDDRERRSALLSMITAGWELRDRAADAYGALEREADEGGIARGVLE
jgi:hypothetical protein